MSKWNPDEHLPECGVTQYPICICDRLRACERRVREDDKNTFLRAAYETGREDGLDAAWEAVAKIPREDGGYCHVLHACDVEAAIDYLRQEQK